MKPLNLIFRFLLEITALVILAIWGWNQSNGLFHFVFAAAMPVLFASVWGIFAVPNDPSRSGKAVVEVPGWLRLIIELILFGFAAWSFFDLGYRVSGFVFTSLLLFHHLSYFERLKWLLRH